jgi:hypothetical protein
MTRWQFLVASSNVASRSALTDALVQWGLKPLITTNVSEVCATPLFESSEHGRWKGILEAPGMSLASAKSAHIRLRPQVR